MKRESLTAKMYGKRMQRFEKFAFPKLGWRPIAHVTAPEFLAMVKPVGARGANVTTRLLRSESGQVFRYAIATGRVERDVTTGFRGALALVRVTHHAGVTHPAELGSYCGRSTATEDIQ